MIDTHSHIQFRIFDKYRNHVIEDARKIGITKIIAVGTNIETSKNAVEISERYPEVFASVGIHPHHIFGIMNNASGIMEKLENLITSPKVVAIGETGMDKHLYESTKYESYLISKEFIELQKEFFKEQIKLAIKYNKALIIHNREAIEETLEILEKNWDKFLEKKAVFHMCEPDEKLLKFAKEHNIFISFGGDITYDSAKQNFLKEVPLDLLVLETDSPFFIPDPLRHSGDSERSVEDSRILNTPTNLNLISEKIAKLINMNLDNLKEVISKNSLKLFGFSSL